MYYLEQTVSDLNTFREESRTWLEENCPEEMRNISFHWEDAHLIYARPEADVWVKRMAAKGWVAPTWPKEYGGGGLSASEAVVLSQEMKRVNATAPSSGMGLTMIGPTLLEYGTPEQKQRHIPKICDGSIRWCQGYSEPGAGSDLAALQTRAVLDGDHFVINGQKTWTSGAQYADWMFALVRTDPSAPKHEGISFVLFDMHQDGVTVKPIALISGSSPFCETFLDNIIARRDDLVGELNRGWTVGKRLLQFERSGIGGLAGASKKKVEKKRNELAELAKQYSGEANNRIADPGAREKVLNHSMRERAFQLTTRRVNQENQSGKTPGATTSIFKLVGANLARDATELKSELMGFNGLGWEGDSFTKKEIDSTRNWLNSRAVTIYGGTNEVQMNIIGKRVLGLPD
jgi:alkylation response protein AidB-like acyl-CoA dehydrogenase